MQYIYMYVGKHTYYHVLGVTCVCDLGDGCWIG
jgi:hypothetical protein